MEEDTPDITVWPPHVHTLIYVHVHTCTRAHTHTPKELKNKSFIYPLKTVDFPPLKIMTTILWNLSAHRNEKQDKARGSKMHTLGEGSHLTRSCFTNRVNCGKWKMPTVNRAATEKQKKIWLIARCRNEQWTNSSHQLGQRNWTQRAAGRQKERKSRC